MDNNNLFNSKNNQDQQPQHFKESADAQTGSFAAESADAQNSLPVTESADAQNGSFATDRVNMQSSSPVTESADVQSDATVTEAAESAGENAAQETVQPIYVPDNNRPNYNYGQTYNKDPYQVNESYYRLIHSEPTEEQKKKKEIRRLSNATVLPLLINWGAGEIIVYTLAIICMIVMGQNAALALLNNPDFNYLFNGFFSIIFLSLPMLITARWTKQPLSKTVNLKPGKLGRAVPVIMLGFGVIAVANYAGGIISNLFNSVFGEQVVDPMPEFGTGTASFIINMVCVGLIPAIMEEFAFRGVILGTTRKYTSDGFAVLTNALLFSLLHGNLNQIPFTFMLGLYLAYITVYTGSVLPAMVVHGVNNGLAVALSMLMVELSPINQFIISGIYSLVLLLVGVCGFILLTKAEKFPFKLSKERSEGTGKVAKYYYSSVCFIIFAVYAVIKVITTQALY